jgi:hypothetical protein
MEMIAAALIVLVALGFFVWPVQLAAKAMGAKRTGFFWCLIALIGASVLHAATPAQKLTHRTPDSRPTRAVGKG